MACCSRSDCKNGIVRVLRWNHNTTLISFEDFRFKKHSSKVRAIFNEMTESFAPSTHRFSAVKHNMSLKAASVTDHGGGSRNKYCVTIIFVMVTVMYVSMTSRASSVIGRCPSLVVGVIFLDDYWIVKRARWGSMNRRTRIVRGLRSSIGLSSRSLNGGREGRWIRWYHRWRPSCPMMMMMVSFFSKMYHWL